MSDSGTRVPTLLICKAFPARADVHLSGGDVKNGSLKLHISGSFLAARRYYISQNLPTARHEPLMLKSQISGRPGGRPGRAGPAQRPVPIDTPAGLHPQTQAPKPNTTQPVHCWRPPQQQRPRPGGAGPRARAAAAMGGKPSARRTPAAPRGRRTRRAAGSAAAPRPQTRRGSARPAAAAPPAIFRLRAVCRGREQALRSGE